MEKLRLVQFNVLAPSARICRPLDQIPWQQRQSAICSLLLQLDADIVALQEFDFSPQFSEFSALYDGMLGARYERFEKPRTGRKTDGLALLLKKNTFTNVQVQTLDLQPECCDRVAIVASMTHSGSQQQLNVCTTHLTVAHADNGYDIPHHRPLQMKQILQTLSSNDEEPPPLVILAGDLNCDHLETDPPSSRYTAEDAFLPVTMAFEAGFISAFHEHLPEADDRPISHTCSYAQDGCCDYVMYKPTDAIRCTESYLYPMELPASTQWDQATGWDPLGLSQQWNLSDHRPMVSEFELTCVQ